MSAPEAAPIETLRIHQANERTMLAWLRTGIALMAFGFAIARFAVFLRQVAAVGSAAIPSTHGFGSAWLGAALVAAGMITSASATLRYHHVRRAIERGNVGAPSPTAVYLIGSGIAFIGLVMTWLLLRALQD